MIMSKNDICKKCKKKKLDLKQGILCGLTNEKPTFENSCPNFDKDEAIKELKETSLKPNEQRSKTVLSFIWIVLILEIFSLASSGLQYNLLRKASEGVEITYEVINANDFREQVISIIYLIAFIISGITFIMWFRRAYFNLHLKVNHLSYKEEWAARSWFIPFVNLYQPYQIMKELYTETKNYLVNEGNSIRFELTTSLLGFWWTLWIVNGIIGQIIFRLSSNADTMPKLLTTTTLSLISSVIGLGLAIVTIRVIKEYSKLEGFLIKQK